MKKEILQIKITDWQTRTHRRGMNTTRILMRSWTVNSRGYETVQPMNTRRNYPTGF